MGAPHVPVSVGLALPFEYEHVQRYLQTVDDALRLRKSAERRDVYILERRCRRRPAVNTGMRDVSDMHIQARDGYIHVASVHPNFLNKPWNLVRALTEEGADLFATGAHQLADEEEYEDRWQRETRQRRRKGLFRDIAKEGFDILSRLGNRDGTERTRISNPGLGRP